MYHSDYCHEALLDLQVSSAKFTIESVFNIKIEVDEPYTIENFIKSIVVDGKMYVEKFDILIDHGGNIYLIFDENDYLNGLIKDIDQYITTDVMDSIKKCNVKCRWKGLDFNIHGLCPVQKKDGKIICIIDYLEGFK